MKDERWDLLDADGKAIGRTHPRGDPMPDGLYHLVVHVWLRNGKGAYLLSRRHPDKAIDPLLWECTGGSVLAGEDSATGALREVKEELGIALTAAHGKRLQHIRRNEDLVDVWLFPSDVKLSDLTLQPDEVIDARWATYEEIGKMEAEGLLVPTLGYFRTLLPR